MKIFTIQDIDSICDADIMYIKDMKLITVADIKRNYCNDEYIKEFSEFVTNRLIQNFGIRAKMDGLFSIKSEQVQDFIRTSCKHSIRKLIKSIK